MIVYKTTQVSHFIEIIPKQNQTTQPSNMVVVYKTTHSNSNLLLVHGTNVVPWKKNI
jgi:hypothetical protein